MSMSMTMNIAMIMTMSTAATIMNTIITTMSR